MSAGPPQPPANFGHTYVVEHDRIVLETHLDRLFLGTARVEVSAQAVVVSGGGPDVRLHPRAITLAARWGEDRPDLGQLIYLRLQSAEVSADCLKGADEGFVELAAATILWARDRALAEAEADLSAAEAGALGGAGNWGQIAERWVRSLGRSPGGRAPTTLGPMAVEVEGDALVIRGQAAPDWRNAGMAVVAMGPVAAGALFAATGIAAAAGGVGLCLIGLGLWARTGGVHQVERVELRPSTLTVVRGTDRQEVPLEVVLARAWPRAGGFGVQLGDDTPVLWFRQEDHAVALCALIAWIVRVLGASAEPFVGIQGAHE